MINFNYLLASLVGCSILGSANAHVPLCTSQETAATKCWTNNTQCLLNDDCDVPDPDPDKTCAEENAILDDAGACCPVCADAVEAIRECRCPSTGTGPTVRAHFLRKRERVILVEEASLFAMEDRIEPEMQESIA